MTSTSYSKEEVEKLLEEKLEERTQILRSELQASYKQELEDALGSQGKEPKYDRKDLRSEIQAAYTQELEVALGSQGKEPKYERKESGVTFALPPEAVKEDNADDADDADDFFVVDGEDNGLMKRKSVIDEAIDIGVEIPLLPEDTFSFFAFSRKSSTSLVAAVFVICFQLISLSLIGLDMFSAGTPENRLGVPIRVSPATSTIQVLALLISVFSQTDYQDSLNTLYSGHENQRWEERLGVPVPYWRWQASLWIRFCVSLLGLVMTFLLIVSESDASELLLDFTAIEFITNLDNIFFWLCAWGYLGIEAQRDAARVALATPNRIRPTRIDRVLQDGSIKTATHLTVSAGDRPDLSLSERDLARRWSMRKSVRTLQKKLHPSRFPRFQFLCVLCFAAIIGWAVVFYRQVTGYYVCNYAYVEFSDFIAPELASFNGFYEQIANGRRNEYVEVGHGKFSKTVRFGFCLSLQGWTFSYAEDDDICQWQTKSADMSRQSEESYILVGQENSAWTIKDHRDRVVPLTDLVLKCMDCKHDTSFCGERGTCVNNRCVCEDGSYGNRCEFVAPCDRIEYDPTFEPFQGNRKWAEGYDLLKNGDGRHAEVYGRPVYLSQDRNPDVIFYNGYRWAIASLSDINKNDGGSTSLVDFFENEFHAFWSQYTVGFLSEPVSIDAPDDSNTPAQVSWYQAQVKTTSSFQGSDLNKPVESKFLCAKCNNDTNPCLFGGVCIDHTCKCTQGSFGKLCHIPPTGNGYCDSYFNTLEFDFDGGDCCKETCVSTLEHTCGEGIIGQSFGVDAFGYVGFNECKEEGALQGVTTLSRIKKRGNLICGASRSQIKQLSQFYENQCRAIAAAIFGNPPSFEMSYFETDRFNELKSGVFDVLFGSDFTASRDISEKTSQLPFTFAALPSLFSGMVFGGVAPFPSCAEDLDYFSERCLQLKICVRRGTTFEDAVHEHFPAVRVVTVSSNDALFESIDQGLCNVIVHYPHILQYSAMQAEGYQGDSSSYEVTTKTYTKSFETWMTRPDDRVWSQFVNWVMEALVQAEESGVSKASSWQMSKTFVFGEQYQDMFRNAVGAVGNYGDLWNNMPFSRSGLNLVNDGSSGRILSMDLGAIRDEGPPPRKGGRIEGIRTRGVLRCGMLDNEGFASLDPATSTWSGMDIDLCKGIAGALFDGEGKIKIVPVSFSERFTSLEGGAVDVVFSVTRTLEREMKYPGTGGTAFDFSPIYFHDGLIFSGSMPHGKCAEDLNFSDLDCRTTKICVPQGTTWLNTMLGPLDIPELNMLFTDSTEDSFLKHVAGDCNAIAGEIGWIKPTNLRHYGYPLDSTDYYFGTKTYTKEPLGAITRPDDSQFSDFVRWIMYGYFYAEEKGITKSSSEAMPLTNLFGDTLTNMWQDSIKVVGNYGEIFERNLGGLLKREGYNKLNDGNGPQLYACPGTI